MPLHNMVAEKGGYIIDELVRGYGYMINEAFKFLIESNIEPEELMDMYYPYQEMDVSRAIDEIIDRIKIQTNKE